MGKTKKVIYQPAGKGNGIPIEVPEDWCISKQDIDGSQERAEQYRDFHRLGDILAGHLKYNPVVHKSKIFDSLKGV